MLGTFQVILSQLSFYWLCNPVQFFLIKHEKYDVHYISMPTTNYGKKYMLLQFLAVKMETFISEISLTCSIVIGNIICSGTCLIRHTKGPGKGARFYFR
jgi:hypothetical protein